MIESGKIKTSKLNLPLAALLVAYIIMWCGGVGSHFLRGIAPPETAWAAPLFLTLAGVIVLITTNRKNLAGLLLVAALGFLAEIIGVRYPFLFGAYHYTATLQPQLLGVPLVMMSAWIVLFAYVKQMLLPFRFPLWVESLIASFWMTSIDAVIDPLAAGVLDYWDWHQGGSYFGIPARNFLGWFVVSLVMFNVVRGKWAGNRWAHYTGLSVILFFSLIALAHRMGLVFIIGMALCAIDLMVVFAKKKRK